MSKLISQIKFGVFLGLCAFGLLILAGYIKPAASAGDTYTLAHYESFESYQKSFAEKIRDGYIVDKMTESYNRNNYHYHWTVIYVKRQ